MKKSFGSKELAKCLLQLGFKSKKSTGSSHQKYFINKKLKSGTRPFITIILGRKVFDRHTQHSYLRQIQNLGYSIDEIEKALGIKK